MRYLYQWRHYREYRHKRVLGPGWARQLSCFGRFEEKSGKFFTMAKAWQEQSNCNSELFENICKTKHPSIFWICWGTDTSENDWKFTSIEVSIWGEQGWRSGGSTRLPPMWPGFDSRTRRHTWVEFVVGSLLCSERFFSGYSGFPPSARSSLSDPECSSV